MKQFFAFTFGIAMMLVALPLQAQDHTVSGRVVSAPDSQPLAGAAVVETGTTNGTATARDGSFSLEVDNPNASLMVSFVGFTSQTIEVEGRNEVTITLEKDTGALEGRVVTVEGDTETVIVRGRGVPRIQRRNPFWTGRFTFTSEEDSTVVVVDTEADTETVIVRGRGVPRIQRRTPFRAGRYSFTSEEDSTVVVVNAEGDTTIVITKDVQPPRIRIGGSTVNARGYTVISEEDSTIMVYPDGRTRYLISRRAPEFVERDVVVNTEGDSVVVIMRGERAMRARIPARMERGRKRVRGRTERHHRRGQSRHSGRMERGRKHVRDRAHRHQWHGRRWNSGRVGRHHLDSEHSGEHAEALREMMVEVHRLAREVRRADEEAHAVKMEALKAKVGELFDRQQSLHAERMEEIQENKEALIEELMDRLLERNHPYPEISRERTEELREMMEKALRMFKEARQEVEEAQVEKQRR